MSEDSHTFSRRERLALKSDIAALFSQRGKSFSAFPLRAIYCVVDRRDADAKVLVSVSKRHFRNAVDRNRAKRQIREAYRLAKPILTDAVSSFNSSAQGHEIAVHVAFVWFSDKAAPTRIVRKRMTNLLHRISDNIVSLRQSGEAESMTAL